mmetsp:Transcript_45250/g.75478  ORF Transcript_45250/g.75478 Transcript_45250/m.75478 type:complete len:492 (+) Transcript_45250:209-1684(+)
MPETQPCSTSSSITRLTSLLLLGLGLLGGGGGHLAKHDRGVTVKEGDAGETFAVLEGVDHEGLLGSEHDLGDLVGLEGVGCLHLLATGLLAHLPLDLGHAGCSAAATHEADGGVANLELAGDVQGLDLGGEVLHGLEGGVGLVDHHVTGVGHVQLVQTLNVHADVVAGGGSVHALVVHLHGEHLARAGVGDSVGGHEDDFLVGLDESLLNAASEHITDTLDLVDPGDGEAHRGVELALGLLDEEVEGVEQGVHVHRLLALEDIHTSPPAHVLRLLDQVVSLPAGDGEHGDGLLDEVLLPANLSEHRLHLVTDLLVTLLLVPSDIAVHLVNTDQELLDTQQVDQARVLAGLALHLTSLVVTLLDGGGEVSVGGNHEEGDVRLGGTGDHVLDEIAMSGGVNDGVMPTFRVELLGGAGDGHTTLALLLLPVHVEGESERRLAEGISLSLQLLDLTLGDTTELENQAPGGGRLTGVDVTADHNGQMVLDFSHLKD